MPKQVIMYQCEFCQKKAYESKSSTVRHEKQCFRNPDMKSCITCDNKGVDANGEDYCRITHHDIFVKGHPIVNCPYWSKEHSEEYQEYLNSKLDPRD